MISEVMNNMMCGVVRKVVSEAVSKCGERYGFSSEEALRSLGVESMYIEIAEKMKSEKPKKVSKAAFPLPFNGENSSLLCQALRQNNGLYTQCQATKKNGNYCKSCQQLADKSEDGIPEYGTISQRVAVSAFEYVDPKGRKPTAYTKVMNKYKLTQEQVLEEAAKFGIQINADHFVAPEEPKRGRKAAPKEAKEPKEAKGVKGRPKKSSKVIQLADDDEDLFASLVASASAVDEEETQDKAAKKAQIEQEKQEKAAKLAQEKQEKAAKLAQEKAEKAAKLEQEKAEKAAKLEQEKAEKAAKLALEKAEKAAKLEQEKAEKAAKKAQIEQEKQEKAAKKKAPKSEEPEEEETYKKCGEVDGVKYIRSQQTNIVYDFNKYTESEELHPVGKWNAETKSIIFNKDADSDSELEDDEIDL